MRVLLDTNLLIGREDPKVLPPGLARLLQVLQENRVGVFVHPTSLSELEGDQDPERRRIIRSKADAYPLLERPPSPGVEFLEAFGVTSSHDRADARLAYAVARNAVSFLVTEDHDLVHRASRVGLQERVLSVEAGLRYFETYFGRAPPPLPSHLKDVPVHSLDINDPIFDTLKEDYPGFVAWFDKACREGRRCVRVHLPEGGLAGVLLYKEETDEPLLHLPPARRLKIATFKVSDRLSRQGVGELLLSFALNYSQRNRFEECYVTVFPKHSEVIDFLTPFGFRDIGAKENTERILQKRFAPGGGGKTPAPLDYFRLYYPSFLDDGRVHKFLVPVQPQYHRQLFPEYEPRPGHQQTLDGTVPLTFAAGNAIRKAYLSNSRTSKLHPGDVLLFYRSQDERRVTHLGLVEETRVCRSPTEVIDFVGNRTVMPMRNLTEMCGAPVLAILFWSLGPLPRGRPGGITEVGLAPPMSIREIREEDYSSLCKK